MKTNKFTTRYCKRCRSNIGKAWEGGGCPACGASLEEWGVHVDFNLRCPACSTVITDRELCCSECGNQLDGVGIEHEQ